MPWLLLILFVTTLLSSSVIVWELIVERRLAQSGVMTNADILESGHAVTKRNNSAYLIYEFTPAGSTDDPIKRRQMISQSRYERMTTIGRADVKIAYLPTQPKVSRLAGVDADYSVRNVAIIQTSILLVMTIAFLLVYLSP